MLYRWFTSKQNSMALNFPFWLYKLLVYFSFLPHRTMVHIYWLTLEQIKEIEIYQFSVILLI